MNLSRQPVNLLDSLLRLNRTKKKQETSKFYLVKKYSCLYEKLSEKVKNIPCNLTLTLI